MSRKDHVEMKGTLERAFGYRGDNMNLPVQDLDRSVAFFAKLGYGFDPQFTNKDAACLVVDESIYVMLLREDFFATFTPKKVADSTGSTETIIALSAAPVVPATNFRRVILSRFISINSPMRWVGGPQSFTRASP